MNVFKGKWCIVYRDRKDEWRWTVVHSNKRTLGDSGEGYKNKRHCIRMAQDVLQKMPILIMPWHIKLRVAKEEGWWLAEEVIK